MFGIQGWGSRCGAGAGYASHAEVISVPRICAYNAQRGQLRRRAFGTLGAIAMQGVRLAEPTLGEAVVVVGLGLIGQIQVQLLKQMAAAFSEWILILKRSNLHGKVAQMNAALVMAGPSKESLDWTRGRGADAVVDHCRNFFEPACRTGGRGVPNKGRSLQLAGRDQCHGIFITAANLPF